MGNEHPPQKTDDHAALRASELSYRRLFEAARDGILILDLETGRIKDVNPFLFHLLGFYFEEMIGKTVGELSPFKDMDSNQAMLKKLQQHGYVRYEDLPLETRDGRRIAVEFVSNVYQAGDKKVIQCNIRDITARKKSEQQVARLNEEARVLAESSNVVKSKFLANMSHEIRTPMGAVIGLANILALSSPLTEKQKEYVSALQISASSLLALINDLLDISKIEACSIELEQAPFHISKVMAEVVSMLSVEAQEKNLSFTVDDQSIQGTSFIGDPMRLRQILLNLCGNAIKFTEKGSVRVTIKSKPIDAARFAVSIAVADTGIGITKEKMASIFDRFVQADTSISRRYGGTGLGLAISKTLIELMHGSIEVESVPGKGSLFTLRLPLSRVPDPTRAEGGQDGEGIPPSASPFKVLLVEDHEPNILVTSTYLEMMGIVCDVARDGHEAFDKIALNPYALILLDVQMPAMDGWEVTRQIRSQEKSGRLPRLPIIGMTAYALTGDRQRCLDAGMDEYIAKPFSPKELKSKVLASLER